MKRVSVKEAHELAETYYPYAPEELAELLEVEVRRSNFEGDGWCLRYGQRAIIRINNSVSRTRQRFTLAHELGHLVYGTASVVGQNIPKWSQNVSREEQQANDFASQMLLPRRIAQQAVQRLPLSRKFIQKLAQTARVSPVFLARRFTALAAEIGLVRAVTFHYEKQRYQWCFPPDTATLLNPNDVLKDCLEAPSWELRYTTADRVLDAMLLSNAGHNSQTIFI